MKPPLKMAFTLIELLIVVVVIAILSAVAVSNFLEAQTRSKVTRTKTDLRTVATAIESYHIDNNKYPECADNSITLLGLSRTTGFHSRMPTYLTTPVAYLTMVLEDPFVPLLSQSTYNSVTYPISTRVGMRYVYYNPPCNIAANNDIDVWNTLEEWIGGWLLYGYGPDKTAFPGGKSTLVPYDSTNGTASVGQIVRCQKNSETTPPHPITGTYDWP